MGNSSFANMPDSPIMKNFSRSHNKRSGVINDFSCGLEDESGIHENKCYPNDQEYAQIMAMIKPKGKPAKIAKAVLRGKGVKSAPTGAKHEKLKTNGPYLQHQATLGNMDKKIRSIEKKVKGTEKSLKSLEKADKKRDKFVEAGKKKMKRC